MIELTEKYRKELLADLLTICKSHLSSVDEDLITRAFKLSFEAHKNDFRASGEPYFIHPYEVAIIVAKEMPLDDISVVVALLHDVVEDTEYSITDIENMFGEKVSRIVDGLTKLSGDFDSTLNCKKSLESLCQNAKTGNVVVFHDSQKAFNNLKEILCKIKKKL